MDITEEEVMKLAEKIGRKVNRDYPSVERSDIVAEALIRASENPGKNAGVLWKLMERAAYQYASQERYRKMLETSQYYYIPVEVRALLQVYWDPEAWVTPSVRDDHLYAAVQDRTVSVSLMDLTSGLKRLKPSYRKTLERKFMRDLPEHSQAVARAVDALTKAVNRILCNRSHEGPGARRVVPNSKAQMFTRLDHESSGEGDALSKTQALYKQSPSKPAGTFFNWSKEVND